MTTQLTRNYARRKMRFGDPTWHPRRYHGRAGPSMTGKTAVGAASFTRGWARAPGSFVTSISTPQVLGVSLHPTRVPAAACPHPSAPTEPGGNAQG